MSFRLPSSLVLDNFHFVNFTFHFASFPFHQFLLCQLLTKKELTKWELTKWKELHVLSSRLAEFARKDCCRLGKTIISFTGLLFLPRSPRQLILSLSECTLDTS